MSRADTLLPGLFCAVAALAGCGGGAAPPEDAPVIEAVVESEAGVQPLPDFQDYVVGDLGGLPPGRRDPFDDQRIGLPPATPTNPAPHQKKARPRALRLLGIVQRDGRFVALFDGAMVEEGDAVRGWRILSIDERSVLIERHGQQRRLSL